MKIILPYCRALSWNKIYSSPHWTVRRELADEAHQEVISALLAMGIAPLSGKNLIKQRVDLVFTAYYNIRAVDSSNICGKVYEDALKGIILVDDSLKYVRRVTTQSILDRQKGSPRLEIDIIPIDNTNIK